jgi:hypothetical protein
MADLIGLVNEISTFVKLAWVGVLAWGAVQFVWYQRARVFPDATEAVSDSWSAGRQFPSVTRPPEPFEAPHDRRSQPESAATATVAADIDIADVEIAFASAESLESQDAVPRRKSSRRRRAAADSAPGGSVTDFALDTPKAT